MASFRGSQKLEAAPLLGPGSSVHRTSEHNYGIETASAGSTPRSVTTGLRSRPIPISASRSSGVMFPDNSKWDSFSFRRFGGASSSHKASVVAPHWFEKNEGIDDDNTSEMDLWATTADRSQDHLGVGLESSIGDDDEMMSYGIQESVVPISRPSSVHPDENKPVPFPVFLFRASMFGIVNAIIILPVMIGFAQIIFRDPFFAPYMDQLTKLVLFSSIIHQCSFSGLSTLPFAIGQVQDAGLIFLSSMSTSIVAICKAKDATDEEILATTVCWLGISTAALGVALYITGKLKLASMVQYLPMPVVGGYLAFIGLYCGQAGLALMSGKPLGGLRDWGTLGDKNSIILMAPGLCLGLVLFLITSRFRHFAVLPCVLMIIPIGFYVILAAGGWSLDDARVAYGHGWVANSTDVPPFYDGWKFYEFPKVHWDAIPPQIGTWIAMYFVVAFSSSLDVAAIQMDLGRPLNFDKELCTVGLSNFFSGITGGFTGSYIFSQTIFTMRSGTHTRLVGIVLNVILAIAFFAPISFLAFIPRFFFGAVLSLIAIDLMLEWLWHSRHLVFPIEYSIVLGTFVAILITNLEAGMLIGIGLSVLAFVIQYARSKQTHRVSQTSSVVRGFSDRAYLTRMKSSIVAFQLHGHIFFGSAIQILREIKENIFVEDMGDTEASNASILSSRLSEGSQSKMNYLYQVSSGLQLENGPDKATKFLVLDFSQVVGLDATAARSLFAPLAQLLRLYQLEFVATSVSEDMEKLLASHGVHCRVMENLDAGLEWCEDHLLKVKGRRSPHPSQSENLMENVIECLESSSLGNSSLGDLDEEFQKYFKERTLHTDETLFALGAPADSIFFIRSGSIAVEKDFGGQSSSSERPKFKEAFSRMVFPHAGKQNNTGKQRIMQYNGGGVLGELDFMLNQQRTFSARAQETTVVLELTRPKLREMFEQDNKLAAGLQHLILRGLSISCHALMSSSKLDSPNN